MKIQSFTIEDLFEAYYSCRKHKRNTINALKFEINLEQNMMNLYHDLKNNNYEISKSICFISFHPKIREIWAADFRDRIVHHLVYNFLQERFERSFIFDTYSCIRKKGTLKACRRVEKFTRSITNNYQEKAYFLKADVKSFFMGIDKNILYKFLLKKVDELWIQKLLKQIIFNEPIKNCLVQSKKEELKKVPKHKSLWYAPKNKGLPIGNLTSQFFANIYLNELDQFVKHKLKCKYYLRYADDIIIFNKSPKLLNQAYNQIEIFLEKELVLKLHPGKKEINTLDKGINFVGYIIKPHRVYIRNSTVKYLKQKIHKSNIDELRNNLEKYQAALNSYFGMFRHIKGYNLRRSLGEKLKNEVIFPVKDYKKFQIQKPKNPPKNL